MGASKQLSNDLKTNTVQHSGLGEGYKQLSQRFQLSASTVRNTVRKWKTTGTVLIKARSDRPRKNIREAKAKDGENSQRQPTDHLQRPATSSCCRWCHWVLFNNSGHFAKGEAVWESDEEEAFSAHTPQTESLEVCISTLGQASFVLE